MENRDWLGLPGRRRRANEPGNGIQPRDVPPKQTLTVTQLHAGPHTHQGIILRHLANHWAQSLQRDI